MIYVVSGTMRSGTSMMMESLEAGGLPVLHSLERDVRLNDRFGEPDKPNGYFPNEKYYEVPDGFHASPGFADVASGKAVKCLYPGIIRWPVAQCRVVFMRRRTDEIRQSMISLFKTEVPHYIADDVTFELRIGQAIELLRDRRCVTSVDSIWYQDVLDDPLAVFTTLKKKGWPIDPLGAASIPQKSRKRIAA